VNVIADGHVQGENPRCACGALMKKIYSPPTLTYLEFLSIAQPASVRRDFEEDEAMVSRLIPSITQLRKNTSLVVRGSLGRTFGSLGGFMSLTLLGLGIYLIKEAVTNPVDGSQATVLAGGMVLGFSIALLFFLMRPRRRTPHSDD
jgi:hypothetical protein